MVLEIHAFGPGTGEVHALAFSPDGTTLASAGHDGSVLMWDMTGGPGETPGADPGTWLRELGGTDHWRAHVAAWRLARAGDAVIDLLAQRLAPAKPLDEATVAGLRGKFADADFSAREAAAQTLIDHGLPLSPAEWYALRRPDPRAMIGRGDTADDFGPRLLERRKDPLPDSALLPPPVLLPLPERLRSAHAIEALELSASPAARGVLESLSRGEERDPQTREAKKALERMLRKRGPL